MHHSFQCNEWIIIIRFIHKILLAFLFKKWIRLVFSLCFPLLPSQKYVNTIINIIFPLYWYTLFVWNWLFRTQQSQVEGPEFVLINQTILYRKYIVGFEVLTAVSTKMAVFWVLAPCSLAEVYQRFRGPCCLYHQGDHRPDDGGSNFSRPVNWNFTNCVLFMVFCTSTNVMQVSSEATALDSWADW
jgi:hypothetical protein